MVGLFHQFSGRKWGTKGSCFQSQTACWCVSLQHSLTWSCGFYNSEANEWNQSHLLSPDSPAFLQGSGRSTCLLSALLTTVLVWVPGTQASLPILAGGSGQQGKGQQEGGVSGGRSHRKVGPWLPLRNEGSRLAPTCKSELWLLFNFPCLFPSKIGPSPLPHLPDFRIVACQICPSGCQVWF